MPPTRSTLLRALTAVALTGALASALLVACGDPEDDAAASATDEGGTAVRVRWTGGAAAGTRSTGDSSEDAVTAGSLVQGAVEVPPGTSAVAVELTGARPVALPDACVPSDVRTTRSYLDGRTLLCVLTADPAGAGEPAQVPFTALVDAAPGEQVGGQVTTAADGVATTGPSLPGRTVADGAPAEPDLRLVSSPDFLNADVADLRRGPGRWDASRSTNGTNASYERALDSVLADWAGLDPAAVLVAGDLVDGRWGFDDQGTGTFGPTTSFAERRAALRRAARTYYPQWQRRFDEHGLVVAPSVGDHELGDNPFGRLKRRLAPTARREFARQFTLDPDGSPRYADHPRGPARLTAWAARPSPDVQVVSLDPFEVGRTGVRIRLDPQQLAWLEGVLRRARRDGVRWTVVESHVPIAYPVRSRASSALHYEGGTDSDLWRSMRRYGVDLYLSGEVHDTQLVERDGIVQVSHGGAFQFGLTTALVLDVHGDRLALQLRDYDISTTDRGERLWETRRGGMRSHATVSGSPRVIGTATLDAEAGLVTASGILAPP